MTKRELARRALKRLNVDPDDPENLHPTEDAYSQVYQQLLNDSLAVWDEDNIPDYAVPLVSVMVAAEVADNFSLPEQFVQRLILQKAHAEVQLRKQIAPDYQAATTVAEYF